MKRVVMMVAMLGAAVAVVEQMRTNDYCGVTCEPGLLFFPCNNHPHYALKLFAKLGHGDWSDDARRWTGISSVQTVFTT